MSDRYEIKSTLGRGGMGAVYHALDTVMGRNVALKRLLPLEETNLNEAAGDSLKREAEALARFSHPNIVTIYAFEEDADGPFVVMEKVDGDDLKKTIEKGALAVNDFIELTEQILDPLIAAKDLNLLHRDIKPANIMLNWLSTGRFQVKILDFGLAKFSEKPQQQTLDQKGFFLGSIDYLAPEQLQCMALDQRTDLYSLGCVLYFCLAQVSPFHGDNPADTTRRHMDHLCEPIHRVRPDLPTPLADWLMRMISRHRSDRPSDAREALEEFIAAKAGISPVSSVVNEGRKSVVVISDKRDPEVSARPDITGVTAPPGGFRVEEVDDEDDDIPIARIADTGPRMILVGEKMQARPNQNHTGPLKSHTGPLKSLSGLTGATVPVRQQKSAALPLVLIVFGICVVTGILVLVLKDDPQPQPRRYTPPSKAAEASNSASSTNSSTSAAVKVPPYKPTFPPQSAAKFVSPSTIDLPTPISIPDGGSPVTNGLRAHYRADLGTFGPDLKTPAKLNDRMAGWANLAPNSLEKDDLCLYNEDFEVVAVPRLVDANPEIFPDVKPGLKLLDFRNSTLLRIYDWQTYAKEPPMTSMTVAAVLRNEPGSSSWLRFEGDQRGGFVTSNHGGTDLQFHYNIPGKRQSLNIKLPLEKFVVVTYVIDGLTKTHQVRGQASDRKVITSSPQPLEIVPVDMRIYQLGTYWKPQTGKNPPSFFKGQISEFLFFDRALSTSELESLEKYLAQRTFR